MKRSLVAALVAIALIAAACGGSDDSSDPAPTSPSGSSPAPTITVAALPTPLPTAAADPGPPPGWQRYETAALTIDLPASYVGGSPGDAQTLAAIRALGTGCVAAADLIASQAQLFAFGAVDGGTCSTASIHSIQILQPGPIGSGVDTPDEFIAAFLPGLPSTATLLTQRSGEIGGKPAAFLHVRRSYPTQTTVQALYAIGDGETWHILAAAASESDFPVAVVGYDQIAQTVRIK